MTTEPNLLLVDDDPGMIQVLSRMLAGCGSMRYATSGSDALRLAREATPDLILLDGEMPGMSGFEVCRKLKADASLAEVPVIFVTSHSAPEMEVAGLELGAADFISKPLNGALVLARVRTQLRLKHMADELRRMARVDGLTGVANRRMFDERLAQEWLRARRSGKPLALLLCDVDHFKLFNDRYGHQEGDACLCAVAQAMEHTKLRPADLVARYGGEEFAVLLPETPAGGAQRIAERLLAAVQALAIAHEASPVATTVTISIGICCFDESSETWSDTSAAIRGEAGRHSGSESDLLRGADQALYAAKAAGRAQAKMISMDEACGGNADGAAGFAAKP